MPTNDSCTGVPPRPTCCAALPGHREKVTLDVDLVRHSQAAGLLSGLKMVGVPLQPDYVCVVMLSWQQ